MSIQFLCVSCRKPIEVDDQWAMKIVQCPYCQEQVTAPGMSTYQPEAPAMARQVAAGGVGSGSASSGLEYSSNPPYTPSQPHYAEYGQAQPAPKSNVVAVVSLVLAVLSLVLFIWGSTLVVNQVSPILQQGGSVQAQQAAMEKFLVDAANRQEPWILNASLLAIGGIISWIAAVVCGLIGISRPLGRGLAIAGLIVAAIPVVIFMFGLLVQ